MLPVLIRLGPIPIRTYGLLFAIGILLGLWVSSKLARKEGIDSNLFLDFVFYLMIFSLLGAKLLLLFTNMSDYLHSLSEFKYLLISGGTFYGGLIGGILFTVFFVRKKRLLFRSFSDVVLPGLALGHFFGRLGCFAAGCCHGRAAGHFPLAVEFTNIKAFETTGVPLHIPLYPTQIFEAAFNLLNFFVLLILFHKRSYKGQVTVWYLVNYSLIRFVLEYFRGDPDRGYIWETPGNPFTSLSIPQLISICGIITAFILALYYKKKTGEKENLS